MITEQQYSEYRQRYNAYEAWRNGRSGYHPEQVPENIRISNEERSAIEVYEFHTDPPIRYFAYVNVERKIITTWTGDQLGQIAYFGPRFSLFGNKWNYARRIRVVGDNGLIYHGTYYESAGDYCRLDISKASRP